MTRFWNNITGRQCGTVTHAFCVILEKAISFGILSLISVSVSCVFHFIMYGAFFYVIYLNLMNNTSW
jgi:hypothetical protein